GTYVDTDAKNSDRYIVNLVQGGLGLPDESYYRDEKFAETRAKYVDYLTRMFKLVDRAEPAEDAATVVRVETRLAQGHWERAETRDVQRTYNLRTLAEVEQLCPSFDWRGWVGALGGDESTVAEGPVRQASFVEEPDAGEGRASLDAP